MISKKNITLIISLLIISILITSGGIIAQKFPLTVLDDLDEKIVMEEKPEKIISLSPNTTEILFAVGAGDNIIGVTTFADYPEKATKVEKIGTITEPNIEKIITMEPDLVIAASVNKMETVERLKELNIKVAGFSSDSVEIAVENIQKIGLITGNQEKADQIAIDMKNKMNLIKNLVEEHLKTNEKPKVFYELWNDPLFTAGKNNFVDDLIQMAGGINIGRLAEGQWPQYSLEKLLIEDPDVYISTPHSAQMEVSVEGIKSRERFQPISAIQNDRIYIIDANILNRASPRLITGLKHITKSVFPELSEQVDEIVN